MLTPSFEPFRCRQTTGQNCSTDTVNSRQHSLHKELVNKDTNHRMLPHEKGCAVKQNVGLIPVRYTELMSENASTQIDFPNCLYPSFFSATQKDSNSEREWSRYEVIYKNQIMRHRSLKRRNPSFYTSRVVA